MSTFSPHVITIPESKLHDIEKTTSGYKTSGDEFDVYISELPGDITKPPAEIHIEKDVYKYSLKGKDFWIYLCMSRQGQNGKFKKIYLRQA